MVNWISSSTLQITILITSTWHLMTHSRKKSDRYRTDLSVVQAHLLKISKLRANGQPLLQNLALNQKLMWRHQKKKSRIVLRTNLRSRKFRRNRLSLNKSESLQCLQQRLISWTIKAASFLRGSNFGLHRNHRQNCVAGSAFSRYEPELL